MMDYRLIVIANKITLVTTYTSPENKVYTTTTDLDLTEEELLIFLDKHTPQKSFLGMLSAQGEDRKE